MFIDIVENNKKKHKSLIISSRRTPIKNMSLWFDDFFTCFIVQKPLYLHLQVCFSNGLQSHLYGIEMRDIKDIARWMRNSNRTFMELK